jgi:hydroxymethylbilane synthase
MMKQTLRIATRASALALKQTSLVAERLRAAYPDLEIEVVEVRTTGDRDSRPFAAIGGKGLFVAEVEHAVLDDRADVAVHSAKDLTAELAPGCAIVCVPERAAANDVVVGGEGASGEERLGRLEPGAVVGTSSMRRRALLNEAREDLEIVELRGNIDTRLRKVAEGQVDVAILAAAGIDRLGGTVAYGALDEVRWVPAPAQGALALEALEERADLKEMLRSINDGAAWNEIACERAFAQHLEGGCSVPLGCRARATADGLVVTGFLGTPDGIYTVRDRISGPLDHAEALGVELAQAIVDSGGSEILEELKGEAAPEVPAP